MIRIKFIHKLPWLIVKQQAIHLLLVTGLLLFAAPSFSQPALPMDTDVLVKKLVPPEGRIDVVLDTDTYNEIDDQFAVVYALLSPERINLKAIYAAPFHNSRSTNAEEGMVKSYDELTRLLAKMNISPHSFVYHGSTSFLTDANQPVESEAAKNLIDLAMNAEAPLYVLSLGAPTNIASAILMEPKIINKIIVVWLGGKGLNWPTASEFNLRQDLYSSKILFDSGVPLVQIPTEPVSSHLLTTLPEVEHHLRGYNDIGDYLVDIFKGYREDHFAYAKVIWDIAVVAYIINHDWVSTNLSSTPILTDQVTYSVDNNRQLYKVATYVNRNKVLEDLFIKIQHYED